MKKTWAIRKDAEAVSPVIATILMVAITVVLAAVLYVMVLGFGTGGGQTPTATYADESVLGGRKVTILAIEASDDVPWDDVTVQLTDGTNFAAWEPLRADLDDGPGDSMNYSSDTLGSLTVYCWVYDLGGDGYVSGSDYIIFLASWTDGTSYEAWLLYEDNSEKIGNGASWTG